MQDQLHGAVDRLGEVLPCTLPRGRTNTARQFDLDQSAQFCVRELLDGADAQRHGQHEVAANPLTDVPGCKDQVRGYRHGRLIGKGRHQVERVDAEGCGQRKQVL